MSRALALVDASDESRKQETATPLVETKLYVPRPRSGLVHRPRLFELLRHGDAQKLVLVTAPAGFGKTTVVAAWIADSLSEANLVGWVSLDPSENDPRLFWTYVVIALRRVHAAVGADALTLLQA